jgi:hypothetical protein
VEAAPSNRPPIPPAQRGEFIVTNPEKAPLWQRFLLLLAEALSGCGDDPYRSAVSGLLRDLDTAVFEVEILMNGDSAGQQTGADAQAAYRENLEQAMTRMSAAIEQASQGLGALTPPDAQARSFQESYLAGLQDYQDGIAQLTEAFGLDALEVNGYLTQAAKTVRHQQDDAMCTYVGTRPPATPGRLRAAASGRAAP